jgi:penicillin-binding protein 2
MDNGIGESGTPPSADPGLAGTAGNPAMAGTAGSPLAGTEGGAPQLEAGTPPVPSDQWITQTLPPGYVPPPPAATPKAPAAGTSRRRPAWMLAVSVVLALLTVGGGVFAAIRTAGITMPHPGTQVPTGCATGTPCQVANAYLEAFTGGHYEAMYSLTSAASRQRFSSPAILAGNYTDAHDYIVNRTAGLINEAGVYSIAATPGAVKQTSDTTATVPVQLQMSSSWVGDFSQAITLPLVKEAGKWRVSWSPGLVFAHLDDPNDPTYQRRVHLFAQSGMRGTIYDRDGNVLAQDQTVYTIGVQPGLIKNAAALTAALSGPLDLTPDQITAAYQGKPANAFVPLRTLPSPVFSQIQTTVNSLPGVQVQTSMGRVYPYGATLAPVTGYVSVVQPQDLQNDASHYYSNDDVVGRTGVEAWGEQYLRPVKGGTLSIVPLNADGSYGNAIYVIAQRAAANGADIHTTISLASEQAAMAQLASYGGKGGGAVAVDPTTGEVLVLASYPSYDPNDFALGGPTPNEWARLNALDHPFVNRAVSAAYPIGSVFKLITLAAALGHGVSPTQVFTCPGSYQVPGETHLRIDDDPHGHGTLTAPQAIAPSCDVVYWKLAVQLNSQDPTILPATARAFGLGAPTGLVGVPGEDPGLVPDPQWLQQNQHATWTPTDAANLGIGQGFLQATPAQVAMVSAALANQGIRMQPRLVTSVMGSNGVAVTTFPAQQAGTIPVTADNLRVIQTAMVASTAQPNGTSYALFHTFPVLVAGKTGTAESGQPLPHAWFTCFAPASPLSGPAVTPKIAIGAVVEYAGTGAQFADPLAKRILATYLGVSG